MSATTSTATTRGERLSARLTPTQKALLRRAAEIEGRSLTDFVLASAQAEARRVLERQHIVALSARDQRRLVGALLKPQSNAALDRAARKYPDLAKAAAG